MSRGGAIVAQLSLLERRPRHEATLAGLEELLRQRGGSSWPPVAWAMDRPPVWVLTRRTDVSTVLHCRGARAAGGRVPILPPESTAGGQPAPAGSQLPGKEPCHLGASRGPPPALHPTHAVCPGQAVFLDHLDLFPYSPWDVYSAVSDMEPPSQIAARIAASAQGLSPGCGARL